MEERKEPQFWLKMAQIQQKLVSVAESLVRMKNPQFGGNKFCFWVKDAHVWLENDFVNVHVDEALILEKKAWFWLKNGFFCFGSSLSRHKKPQIGERSFGFPRNQKEPWFEVNKPQPWWMSNRRSFKLCMRHLVLVSTEAAQVWVEKVLIWPKKSLFGRKSFSLG